MEAIVASCRCCNKQYTADAWEVLEQLKPQHVPACPEIDDTPAYDVLLANCACGTTLGWELPFCECGEEAAVCDCRAVRDNNGDSYVRFSDRCKVHAIDLDDQRSER